MTALAQLAATLCYLGAAFAGLRAGPGPSGRAHHSVAWGRSGSWLIALGMLLQAVGFFGFHRVGSLVPLESFGAALSLVAWLIAAAFLLSLGVARIRAVGPWVGVVAAILSALGWLAIELAPAAEADAGGAGGWPHAHVLLSTGGMSVLALASLFGLAYLAKERSLKNKAPARLQLPSLESLDRAGHVALAVGFPFLTLGVFTGVVWGMTEETGLWTGHAVLSLAAWGLYLPAVALRVVRRQHGDQPARGVVISFLFLAVSYAGVRLWGAVM